MELNERTLKIFMKEYQKEIGHPLNVFEYLQAISNLCEQTTEKGEKITDEQFEKNKNIVKCCFNLTISILKEFGITEKDGYKLDYLYNN